MRWLDLPLTHSFGRKENKIMLLFFSAACLGWLCASPSLESLGLPSRAGCGEWGSPAPRRLGWEPALLLSPSALWMLAQGCSAPPAHSRGLPGDAVLQQGRAGHLPTPLQALMWRRTGF